MTGWLILAAIVITVYIVLGVLYESFIHPVTIPRPCIGRGRCVIGADGVQHAART